MENFLTKGKTKTQINARKSFDYHCRRASRCRHDRYISSCNGCPDKDTCEIQDMITKAKNKM